MRVLLLLLVSFGCSAEYVNVNDYPSFNDAALASIPDHSAGDYGHVIVPSGFYHITEPIITPAVWHVQAGAEFTGIDNYPNGIDNLSFLTGAVVKESARGRLTSFTYGSPHFEPYVSIRDSVTPGAAATMNVVATHSGAIAAYATTGDKEYSEGNIGVKGYCVNGSINKQNCWAGYFETNKAPWAGTTTTIEVTAGNYGGSLERILPSGQYSHNAGITTGLWIGGAAGNGAFDEYEAKPTSAAIAIVAGAGDAGFDAGIVCLDEALENSTQKECLRLGVNSKVMWHASGFNPRGAITVVDNNGNGELHLSIWAGGKKTYKFTKDGIITPDGNLIQ